MSSYSIKQLEQLSNVKAHTIRIWEQRYNMFTPQRSDTNIRLYDDEQLKKLLNVCILMNHGMKISAISKFNQDQISKEIDKITISSQQNDQKIESIINQLIISISNFDEAQFDKIFSSVVWGYGLLNTYVKIIYPMLSRIGFLWLKSNVIPAQEHFVSNLIKQKLFAAIDALPIPTKTDQTWILFLKENEEHEIGLLFANFLIRQSGRRVIYLGQRIPYDNLKEVIQLNNPTHLFTFFVTNQEENSTEKFINKLSTDYKNLSICISGKKSCITSSHKNVLILNEVLQLLELIHPETFNNHE